MIENAPQTAREFHTEPDGKRWLLTRDLKTGRPYVLYRHGENELPVELDLGSFLVLFQGQERDKLLQLIASLLPDAGAPMHDGTNVVRPPRFMSRWMPNRQG